MTRVHFDREEGVPFDATLGAVIAEGGTSIVRQARRANGDTIVVKAARKGSESLLEYERHICGRIDHPALVRYLGAGTDPQLGLLLAFEMLAGNPLLVLNGQRPTYRDPGTYYYPLPPGRALELAFDLLLALEHLHEQGHVHADVKLANLLTRTSGGAGGLLREVALGSFQGVLIDLGSVRSVAVLEALSAGTADPSLIPSITPLYAPPEALFERAETGGRKLFSPSMDIYAFGLVFYVLLTGRIPYEHKVGARALKERELVLELKNREGRGELSPIDTSALSKIPLHDVAFDGSAATSWPYFHASVKEILRRCLEPDPRRRAETGALRELFQEAFKVRPPLVKGQRAFVQTLFQMRPLSNRLLGDEPLGGIRIREANNDVVVEEVPPAKPEMSTIGNETTNLEDGSTITFRSQAITPKKVESRRLSKVPPAPKGMVYLADVLREFKAKKPLPVSPPVLVTRTGFAKEELVQCLLFSLGQARQQFQVSDANETVVEQRRVTIGRGVENDVVFKDGSVSKVHAHLERDASGDWWICDDGSMNGTFLDGNPVPANGRLKITLQLATIELGPTIKVTIMGKADLDSYLAAALQVWTEAFAGKTRSSARIKTVSESDLAQRDETPTEKATEGPLRSDLLEATPRAPTRRQPMPQTATHKIALPPARDATPTGGIPRSEIARRLSEQPPGTSFAVIFGDARAEDCDTANEVLELLAENPGGILGIDAIPPRGSRVIVFRAKGEG